MFIAFYARQSVEKERSVSIETQFSFCASLIKPDEEHFEVKKFADKGYSGKNTNRPDFQKLMDEVAKNNVKKIIVYKLDRISRSLIDFADMLKIFKKHSVEFVSSCEMFDTSSPYGEMIMKLLMVFAEFERESIAGRVRDAYKKRSTLGLYTGGKKIYGFDIVPYIKNGIPTKKYAINSYEAPVVKVLFSEYSKPCVSLRQLALQLSFRGITNEMGHAFSVSRISGMLRNPLYAKADADIFRYFSEQNVKIIGEKHEFDGSRHLVLYGKNSSEKCCVLLDGEGIVDSKTWLACQSKLSKNKKYASSLSNQNSFISGKLFCSKCKRKMTTIKGGSKVYFFCTGKTHAKVCTGTDRTVYVSDIEKLISDCICERLKGIEYAPAKADNDSKREEKRICTHLAEIRKKKTALAKAVSDNNFSSDACEILSIQATQLLNEEKLLLSLLDTLSEKSKNKGEGINLHHAFKNAFFDQKRAVSDILIDRITVNPDASLEIVWKI